MVRNAIYEGTVVHHRHAPVDHRFTYRVAMPFADLDELDRLFRLHPLWSVERPNAVSFRRRDFLPDRPGTLAGAVRDLVSERLGRRPAGPVAMLAHLRTWGWLFNPITLYYCFDADGARVEALVVEVTNTPWHERHVYVVGGPGRHQFAKDLHVSPFFGMDMAYELSYGEPGARLSLSMRATRGEERLFDAGLRLERHDADRHALGRLVWHPGLTTMGVSAGIYRQALRLWLAGTPVVPHPGRHPAVAPGPGRHPAASPVAPARQAVPGAATGSASGSAGSGPRPGTTACSPRHQVGHG